MGISDILFSGRSALLAQQRALDVTGHNVGNVNTPGYARQRAVLSAAPLVQGGGVRLTAIEQIVDRFVEARLLNAESDAGAAAARRDLLNAVQRLLPPGDGSVGGALQEFFAAANEVATHPEDIAARSELLDRASALATQLRSVARGFASLQREADERAVSEVERANALLGRIAELNRGIHAAESAGGGANELRDQRRMALGELAQILGVRTIERDDGTVDVATTSGLNLVSGFEAKRLEARLGTSQGLDGDALHDVGVVAPDGSLIPLGDAPGGALGARLAVRDDDVPAAAAKLDLIATTLRDAVNAVQTDPAGRDLDGNVGGALFTGAGAADLTVVLTDPRGIAAARSAVAGDNAGALALAELQSATFAALSGTTLTGALAELQAHLGTAARDAEDAATTAEAILAGVAAQRDAVSGVSLEEEFTDLIRFQRAFQAAAQMISVGDRMLEELLGMVR